MESESSTDINGYINGIANLGSSVLGGVGDIIRSSQSQLDLDAYRYDPRMANSLTEIANFSPTFMSMDSLHKPRFWEQTLNWANKTGSGAMAGLSFGGWGALAGAIAGTGLGIADNVTKYMTYRQDRNKLRDLNNKLMYSYDLASNEAFGNIKNSVRDMRDYYRSQNHFAEGGYMDNLNPDVSVISNGGSHETNPNGGVQVGYGSNGNPNIVEEGEVIWKGYVFPKRQMPDVAILKKFNTNFKKMFTSYADAAQFILDLHKEREDNAYDQQTLEREMDRLRQAKEYQDLSEEAAKYNMTPEEYTIAVEQLQQQQTEQQAIAGQQQMAEQQQYEQALYEQPFYSGQINQNVFAYGGDTNNPKEQIQTRNRWNTRPLRRLENLASAVVYEDDNGVTHEYIPYKNFAEWRRNQETEDVSRRNYRYDVFTGATSHLNDAYNALQGKLIEREKSKLQDFMETNNIPTSSERLDNTLKTNYNRLLKDVSVVGDKGEKKFYYGSDFTTAVKINQERFNALDEHPLIDAFKNTDFHNPNLESQYTPYTIAKGFTNKGYKDTYTDWRKRNDLITNGYTYARLNDLKHEDYAKGINPGFLIRLKNKDQKALSDFSKLSERDQYYYNDLMDRWQGESALTKGYGFSLDGSTNAPAFITGVRNEPTGAERRRGFVVEDKEGPTPGKRRGGRTGWQEFGIIHDLPEIKEGDKFYDNPFYDNSETSNNTYKRVPVKVANRLYDYISGNKQGKVSYDPSVVSDYDKKVIYIHYIAAHGGTVDKNASLEDLQQLADAIHNGTAGIKSSEEPTKNESNESKESKPQQKTITNKPTNTVTPKKKSKFDVTGKSPMYLTRED